MTVTINGKQHDFAPGTTVAALLDTLDLAAGRRGVAVAVDAEVIPRTEWERTEVPDGATVEVLAAIQGG